MLVKKFFTSSECIADGKLYTNIERIMNDSQLVIHDWIRSDEGRIILVASGLSDEPMYAKASSFYCYV